MENRMYSRVPYQMRHRKNRILWNDGFSAGISAGPQLLVNKMSKEHLTAICRYTAEKSEQRKTHSV